MSRPVAMIRVDSYTIERVFPSIKDAAKASGCSYQRVWDNAKYRRGSKDSRYVFRYIDETDIRGSSRYQKPVVCHDKIDGCDMCFTSPKHAAKSLGVTADYIRNAICKRIAVLNRYEVRYAA